jgi:glycosyltransferase involved in cell wall biosynthesis
VRLVHLADYGGSYGGSFVSMLRALLRAAPERGWEPTVVFSGAARDRDWVAGLTGDGVDVRFLSTGGGIRNDIAALLSAADERVVLHTHFTSFDVPAARVARGRRETSVVWHLHSRARPELPVVVRNILKYAVAGRAVDRILCVAPDLRDAVVRRGAPRERTLFVPNAIDTVRFGPVGRAERDEARRTLDLAPGARVLLHFGWDWHRKGGDLFLDAVKLLVGSGVPVTALTVGGGEEADRGAHALGLGNAVVVHEPVEDARVLYAAADVLVSSSRAEGMPYTVAEALSRGLAVVATEIPGHVVQAEGVSACRLVRLDAQDLADGIRAVLARDPEQTRTERETARAAAVARMDLRGWAGRMLDLYDELATR